MSGDSILNQGDENEQGTSGAFPYWCELFLTGDLVLNQQEKMNKGRPVRSLLMRVVFDGRFYLKPRREYEEGTSGVIPYWCELFLTGDPVLNQRENTNKGRSVWFLIDASYFWREILSEIKERGWTRDELRGMAVVFDVRFGLNSRR
jgi:hypothetical protein